MSDQLSLQFGLQPPVNAIHAWGARAILSATYIDLLPDRQDIAGGRDEAFGEWINTVGLPWLREHVQRVHLATSAYQRVAHVDGLRAIVANPNGSYGYLYIVAYEVEPGSVPDEVETPTPAPRVPSVGEGPHPYREMTDWYGKRKPCADCSSYKSDPIHKAAGRRA